MIDAVDLTKRFGNKVAVDNLSFSVRSGVVTGFLGPNGAGKSTTMRLILGLDRPNHGRTVVNGRSYTRTKAPMTEVGVLLEAKSVHPGRTARNHLRALAATHGLSKKRVDEVIEMVGLGEVARKRAGGFSLGMSQRLGLAAALLGDPETFILDEPVNGLDPEGVAWVRTLVRHLASQGRTIFISSHLMSEMALTADHIIIIGRGRLIADSSMSDLIQKASGLVVKVRSPQASQIAETVLASGRAVKDGGDGSILVQGLTAQAIGEEAARRGWVMYELTPIQRSLEDVYMSLTESSVEFQAQSFDREPVPGSEPVAGRETPPGVQYATSASQSAPGRPPAANDPHAGMPYGAPADMPDGGTPPDGTGTNGTYISGPPANAPYVGAASGGYETAPGGGSYGAEPGGQSYDSPPSGRARPARPGSAGTYESRSPAGASYPGAAPAGAPYNSTTYPGTSYDSGPSRRTPYDSGPASRTPSQAAESPPADPPSRVGESVFQGTADAPAPTRFSPAAGPTRFSSPPGSTRFSSVGSTRSSTPGSPRSSSPGSSRSTVPGSSRSSDPGTSRPPDSRSSDPGTSRPPDSGAGRPTDPGLGRSPDPGAQRGSDLGGPRSPAAGSPRSSAPGTSRSPANGSGWFSSAPAAASDEGVPSQGVPSQSAPRPFTDDSRAPYAERPPAPRPVSPRSVFGAVDADTYATFVANPGPPADPGPPANPGPPPGPPPNPQAVSEAQQRSARRAWMEGS